DEEVDARAAIHLRQAIILGGPLRQCLSAILAFQEKRRGIEVPVVHAHEVVAFTQGVAQHPHHGRFTLDDAQLLAVETELEYPRIAAARLPGQPDLAAEGLSEGALEQEVLSPGYRHAGPLVQRTVHLPPTRHAPERPVEATNVIPYRVHPG